MKRPAVFFDRDNTLIVSDGYLGDAAKVTLVKGAAEAVGRARRAGYATVVVSNQSGVARGMFDEAAVRAVNSRLDQLLQEQDPAGIIDRHEFCPFHPEAVVEKYRQDSELRKPRPGMILSAADKLALDLSRSWVVGDAPRDIQAGKAAGCRTILFCDSSLPPSPAAAEVQGVRPDFVVGSLKEAMDLIEQNVTPVDTTAPAASKTVVAPAKPQPSPDLARLQATADQILQELKRRNQHEGAEFSVSKLLAGIVQILVLAVLFFAYLSYQYTSTLQSILLLAATLQAMVIALLVMGRQK